MGRSGGGLRDHGARALDHRSGRKDLDGAPLPKGRVRRKGGGRRHLSRRDPTLIEDLRGVIDVNRQRSCCRPMCAMLTCSGITRGRDSCEYRGRPRPLARFLPISNEAANQGSARRFRGRGRTDETNRAIAEPSPPLRPDFFRGVHQRKAPAAMPGLLEGGPAGGGIGGVRSAPDFKTTSVGRMFRRLVFTNPLFHARRGCHISSGLGELRLIRAKMGSRE